MSEESDRMPPVTRGELREELSKMETRLRDELTRHTDDSLRGMEMRLLEELARHTRSIEESNRANIGIIDEKYNDLPKRVAANAEQQVDLEARVTRLETAVFPPTPQRKRSTRRRG